MRVRGVVYTRRYTNGRLYLILPFYITCALIHYSIRLVSRNCCLPAVVVTFVCLGLAGAGKRVSVLAQGQLQPLGVAMTREGHIAVTDCQGKRVKVS